MLKLQEQINREIRKKVQEVLRSGKLRETSRQEIVNSVICNYDLTGYTFVDHAGTVRLAPTENADELISAVEKQKEKELRRKKQPGFLKRVKSGVVENSIKKFVEKKFANKFFVEHSRSLVKSESFYITNTSGEKVIKLSLHNTCFQHHQYQTPFINLNNFCSTIELKKVVENKLNNMED